MPTKKEILHRWTVANLMQFAKKHEISLRGIPRKKEALVAFMVGKVKKEALLKQVGGEGTGSRTASSATSSSTSSRSTSSNRSMIGPPFDRVEPSQVSPSASGSIWTFRTFLKSPRFYNGLLNGFMTSYPYYAKETGFCHNSLNTRNVTWNTEDGSFGVSDFSTSFFLENEPTTELHRMMIRTEDAMRIFGNMGFFDMMTFSLHALRDYSEYDNSLDASESGIWFQNNTIVIQPALCEEGILLKSRESMGGSKLAQVNTSFAASIQRFRKYVQAFKETVPPGILRVSLRDIGLTNQFVLIPTEENVTKLAKFLQSI